MGSFQFHQRGLFSYPLPIAGPGESYLSGCSSVVGTIGVEASVKEASGGLGREEGAWSTGTLYPLRDISFVFRSERMSRAWPHVHKFVEDMVKRLSKYDLMLQAPLGCMGRVWSCRGHISRIREVQEFLIEGAQTQPG